MCSPTPCKTCGKTTWSGCGSHVAQVRAMVPDDQWCDEHRATATTNRWWRRPLGR